MLHYTLSYASWIEPLFASWQDAVKPAYSWQDQISLICRRIVLKRTLSGNSLLNPALHASQFVFRLLCCFRYKASWWRQFHSVLWRSWLTNNRDVVILRIRLFQCLVSVTIKIKIQFHFYISPLVGFIGMLYCD